jgi:NAD(P)-dependent dehydrogenase (short-subunit alcohol dehydrogenase family)
VTEQRFTNKTAVVTGAGGTIGRAVCRRLAGEGAAVLAVDLQPGGLEETLSAIEADGGAAQSFVADVTDPDSVAAYVAEAARLGGGEIHAFFNNAGVEGPVGPVEDYDIAAFDQVFAVNVRGVFLGMQHVAPRMPAGGAIVNTASTAALKGFAGLAAYAGSKHAVLGLTRSAALELAPRGIRVNAICPGPVEGRMMTSLEDNSGVDDGHAAFLATVPLGRYAAGEEMATTVAFLLSDDTAFATGAAFVVDGAQTVG